ncbi:MAG: type II toxin-antitoxin system Phd/YefM family antitoxin [Acidobacteria bacterium]|nr:type II toxin-antitoxin system Phd/YefM family antitoxin [Acidobacteriota bacterium]
MKWPLADAKNKLSELIDLALSSGPQFISRRGHDVVVVLSISHYEQLSAQRKPFTDFLLHPPASAPKAPEINEIARRIPGLNL